MVFDSRVWRAAVGRAALAIVGAVALAATAGCERVGSAVRPKSALAAVEAPVGSVLAVSTPDSLTLLRYDVS